MSIQFERNSLYEEVWSIPLTQLGKKYGLSDNGMRKICIALNIPLPKAGHWAKIAAGHQIARAPLPEKSKNTIYVSNPKPAKVQSQEGIDDEIWLNQHESFESDTLNRVVVEFQPKKFHTLLLETHSELKKKVKESENLIIEAQKEANRPKGRQWKPNVRSLGLSYFERSGQLLELHRWGMPLKLTTKTWERGLAIMNTLFVAAEKRGFEILKANQSNKLSFKLDGGEVYIRMSEKLKQSIQTSKDASNIKVPTGILRFHISVGGYNEIEIAETSKIPLEENLNQAFCRIYKLIIKSRAHLRELQEWHRKYKEEEQQREQQERVRQEELRIQAIESNNRNNLLKDAIDWQNAELIYRYVNHLNAIDNIKENAQFIEWKKWALLVANELDPSYETLKRYN